MGRPSFSRCSFHRTDRTQFSRLNNAPRGEVIAGSPSGRPTKHADTLTYMGTYTHILEANGGTSVVELGRYVEVEKFARPMRAFDGVERFALTLWAMPPGLDYDKALKLGQDALEFIQAGGSAEALTVDIRKAGGDQWGVDWVRYVVGHPHSEPEPLDVAIKLPRATELVSRSEVFTPEEAGELFFAYYQTGDIPVGYALRPVQGFTKDGGNVTLAAENTSST